MALLLTACATTQNVYEHSGKDASQFGNWRIYMYVLSGKKMEYFYTPEESEGFYKIEVDLTTQRRLTGRSERGSGGLHHSNYTADIIDFSLYEGACPGSKSIPLAPFEKFTETLLNLTFSSYTDYSYIITKNIEPIEDSVEHLCGHVTAEFSKKSDASEAAEQQVIKKEFLIQVHRTKYSDHAWKMIFYLQPMFI